MGDVKLCAAGKPVEVKRQYTGCVWNTETSFNPSHQNRGKVSHNYMSGKEWFLSLTARLRSTNNTLICTI